MQAVRKRNILISYKLNHNTYNKICWYVLYVLSVVGISHHLENETLAMIFWRISSIDLLIL